MGYRRVPYIPQVSNDDCGAAALAMVMAYHGRDMPLAEVRKSFGADATSAFAVINAARQNGFDAEGVQVDPDALADFSLPAILHWKSVHFVVLESISAVGATLVDPACGPRFVSREEIRESFSGVALIFEPREP